MFELIAGAVFLTVSYVVGLIIDKRHYKSIRSRESALVECPLTSLDCNFTPKSKDFTSKLVCGSVVIGSGYFKSFVAGLKNFFGGSITSYESLLDRARREATLRMRENAKGCDGIMNIRIETSGVAKGVIEIVAYATAIYYKESGQDA